MDLERDGNLIEAGIWFLLAAALFVYVLRSPKGNRRRLFMLAGTLVLFGGSDLVEARTGAWWRPWWLLAWKALCVLVLAWGFVGHYRARKRDGSKEGE